MSWSTTPGSARVLVSPNSLSCLDAILRRILLIIFPLLVFGSPGAQCILSGAANAPIYQCHNLYEQFNRSGWQVWVGLGRIWLVKVTSGSGCFGFKISVQSSFQVHNFTSRNSRVGRVHFTNYHLTGHLWVTWNLTFANPPGMYGSGLITILGFVQVQVWASWSGLLSQINFSSYRLNYWEVIKQLLRNAQKKLKNWSTWLRTVKIRLLRSSSL